MKTSLLALLLGILPPSPPNIVLVTIDTLRADHLGCYGAGPDATPNLDQLAREGARFDQAASLIPLTRPAHASLFTGLYPPEHGVRDNLPARLDSAVPTLTRQLGDAGYHTAAFVGSFLIGRGSGLEAGFDIFSDGSPADRIGATAERRASEVVDEAIRFLPSADSPFFLWVHVFDPHAPYEPPEPFSADYAGEIAYADREIGRLLEALDPRSTVVVVTADHGEGLGDHGEEEHGVFVYEEALRVPLLIRYPGHIDAGSVWKEPISLVDVAPTLLALAGIGSERPLFEPTGHPLYFESYYGNLHFGWAPLRGVRVDRWKLIHAPKPELFDLESDPREKRNLAQEHRDVARRLFANLEAIEKRPTVGLPPAETLEKLASLGYVGSPAPTQTGADPKDKMEAFSDFGARLRVAIDRFQKGEWRKARPVLEELARRDILSFEVHLYLARCHQLAGDVPNAIREYDAASAILDSYSGPSRPWTVALHRERGHLLSRAGKIAEAAAALRRAAELNPEDPYIWNELGALSLRNDDTTSALEAFRNAAELVPENAMFQHNLGFALELSGRPDEPKAAYERALALDPSLEETRRRLKALSR
jgi:tetratricopeptide (TPR) repeat protein